MESAWGELSDGKMQVVDEYLMDEGKIWKEKTNFKINFESVRVRNLQKLTWRLQTPASAPPGMLVCSFYVLLTDSSACES